ncbi:MAG TPA: hypothetical protein VH418_10045 [Solirubrobacteraceae bacterium]|jgi:flagellar biosynthetic protein FliP
MITRHFVRHYVEMVVAMFAGMAVLGIPVMPLIDGRPELHLLGMAAIMTAPMVAWMRYRGHGWLPCWEMSASMFLPTFAAIALMSAGVIGFGAAMLLEHVAMLPAMFAVMLLRPAEYSHHHGAHA